MTLRNEPKLSDAIRIERLDAFKNSDLDDLCIATEDTLKDDNLSFSIGLNRADAPARDRLESYWRGVLLVPERLLIVGRLDGVIASSIQLVKPSPSNQTSAFTASVDHHFVAPWARGHGLAKALLSAAEEEARLNNISVVRLNVRATLESAVRLYEAADYQRWGTLPAYEMVDGKMLAGYFYWKKLTDS